MFIRLLTTLATILLIQSSLASECFIEHLDNAISNNRQRRLQYAKLTNGKSRKVSNQLIFAEKIAKLYGKTLRNKLAPYRKAGIPILCLDFIEMSKAPKLMSYDSQHELSYAEVEKVNIKEIKKDLKSRLENEEFTSIVDYVEQELTKVEKYSRYNCMVKHVLESVARSSFLVPHYVNHAKIKNLKSPLKLLKSYLKYNINALSFSHLIDKRAVSLQEKGISILCGDVPEIPLRLDYEMELSKH